MAIPVACRTKLMENKLDGNSPGWKIVDAANLATTDAPAVLLTKLMHAFYDYGRGHWRWTTSSASSAGAGGLLRGAAAKCACATFNDNLKFLAEKICGVTGIGRGDINEHFLTVPGGVCIDSGWHGNVRTDKQTFDQLRCFKFSTHYWLTLGGANYDACFNKVFHSRADIIWTTLLIDMAMAKKCRLDTDKVRKLAKPLPAYQYIVQMSMPAPDLWPGWQLVSVEQLKKLK